MIDSLLTDTLFIWVEDSAQATGKWTAHGEWRLGGIRDSLFIDLDPELRLDWATWAVGQALERWAQRVLDPALVSWTGPTGPRVSVDALRDGALHDLVTSPSSLARRCAEGDLDRCRRLLDLNAAGDTGISSYDAADLPRLVESSGTAEYLPGRAECVVQLDLARCGELIRDHHLAIPWAATARVRQSLFAFALATGGQDAWLRLQRAAGRSISAQLAAGADRPIDGLIAAWQHDLRSEHRSTTAGLGDALMLAITWSVVGTLLFAWRFRWRRV
jgi:hypothetical protein